ncbi:PVC-type heme-binding CxxCH protein [Portibacter marinus]|uniref:PVC-type heme-binding CxxCH protein n=1 Tax=Portibacter marinus TaxID=2898660 RepID=UPI001F1C099F|nr:PVC-type heme-binding CxxCH protein [Portibacter marinus]
MIINSRVLVAAFLCLTMISCHLNDDTTKIQLNPDDRIVLIGNNLCSRMMNFGHFETELQTRFADHRLTVRNMCDAGNTPGFRPHSSRKSPWAFEGAEKFYQNELGNPTNSIGFYSTSDEWLNTLQPDVILAFFGYNESFRGDEGLENYSVELEAFLDHTLTQQYKGDTTSELVLISPIKFEDLSEDFDYPDGVEINDRIRAYTKVMSEVAHMKAIKFVDLYDVTDDWTDYTDDGFQLTDESYQRLAEVLVNQIFANPSNQTPNRELVHDYVLEKDWMWHNDYKIPNGVHVYGRRYEPFGGDNYPAEIEKIRQMTALRDTAIWAAVKGQMTNLDSLDQTTRSLPEVETNYNPENLEDQAYKYGQEYLETFTMAPGYKVEVFASEEDFPDLANPCQMSFDDKGRLWVSVMPSYPHYKPGDGKPDDKLIILEDTDADGKADKQTIFVDGLHLPVGFEFTPDGVLVSQGTNLKLFTDTDGDDRADTERIIFSGFDDHDTHHNISAFCADPSGAVYMGEGVFLHTSVETAYGPQRSANGGFYRYNPTKNKLDRIANMNIPNPWGTAFDRWGQDFFLHTSGPTVNWMMPSTTKQRYGSPVPITENLIEPDHRVRPTSGLEFISSRHFPDEVQGDMLLNNTIGFLGTKQHQMMDSGTGYETKWRQDLIRSTDGNFRPVDLEFAPDGSLYMVDWHNILVGHMQHNARDPLRDHVHGRVLRITYPERPLVTPAKVHGASIAELFENLKLPEYRARYRSRRALRGKEESEVYDHLQSWKAEQTDEHALLEGLWVSWGINQIDVELLIKLLNSTDHRVRAAAVKVLRYNYEDVPDYKSLFLEAVQDEHGRVRLEAIVASSWLPLIDGLEVLNSVDKSTLDNWMKASYNYGLAHLKDQNFVPEKNQEEILTALEGDHKSSFIRGKELYMRESSCVTCHQEDGNGLVASGFPPLTNSEWVNKNDEVLIKIALKGIYGPITVAGKDYPGQVPMPGYEKMLNDQEIADVLTYVKNAFGDGSSVITADQVEFIRKGDTDQTTYYSPEELLRVYSIQ